MYPPVGGTSKELYADTMLGDTKIPAGTRVFVRVVVPLLYAIVSYTYMHH